MAEYVYPAVFHSHSDGSFTILYPDLEGCISEGKNLGNALYMAQSALEQWLSYLEDSGENIPPASSLGEVPVSPGEFANLVRAVTGAPQVQYG